MSAYRQVEHDAVGTVAGYLPTGYALCDPYAPDEQIAPAKPYTAGGGIILWNGDTVDVLSAWTRDYLTDAPTLLYVRSRSTGESTHVSERDLRILTREAVHA
jgi:hypothetical protein